VQSKIEVSAPWKLAKEENNEALDSLSLRSHGVSSHCRDFDFAGVAKAAHGIFDQLNWKMGC
jgi:hypothetical protein